jgi:hypothetical protein
MNEDESRVHEIRSNALSERMLISQLESALTSPRTPHMKRQLNQITKCERRGEALALCPECPGATTFRCMARLGGINHSGSDKYKAMHPEAD